MPPDFTPNIQWTLLKNLIRSFKLRLRGFHPLRQDISVNFNFSKEDLKTKTYYTTSSHRFWWEFSLSCAVFARRY